MVRYIKIGEPDANIRLRTTALVATIQREFSNLSD